jgi:hypothetical protein
MIVTFKAKPSNLHVGRLIVLDTETVEVNKCECIRVVSGSDVRTFMPIKTDAESPCRDCSLSSKRPDTILGLCSNIMGCGRHMMCLKAVEEVLEEL